MERERGAQRDPEGRVMALVAGLALSSKLWDSPVQHKQVHRTPTSVKATQ